MRHKTDLVAGSRLSNSVWNKQGGIPQGEVHVNPHDLLGKAHPHRPETGTLDISWHVLLSYDASPPDVSPISKWREVHDGSHAQEFGHPLMHEHGGDPTMLEEQGRQEITEVQLGRIPEGLDQGRGRPKGSAAHLRNRPLKIPQTSSEACAGNEG